MRYKIIVLVACLFISQASAANPVWITEGVQSTVFDGYWLQLPKEHNDTEKWPILVWFHGSGATIEQTKWDGPAGKPFAQERFIMINLHLIGRGQFYDDMKTLLGIIDSVIANCAGDSTRLYVGGFSRGGAGTWGVAARAHTRIAAIVPIAAPLRGISDYSVLNSLPIWVGHCAGDPTVHISNSDNAVMNIENAGGADFVRMTDARPQGTEYLQQLHLYSRYPGGNHGVAISLTLDSSHVYQWLLEHTNQRTTTNLSRSVLLYAPAIRPAQSLAVDVRGRLLPATKNEMALIIKNRKTTCVRRAQRH